MKKRVFYFLLQLKKTVRIVPVMVLVGVVMSLSVVLLLTDMTSQSSLARVGIVGDTDNAYVDIASSLLVETKTVEIVEYKTEEEATAALKRMEIQGFASVPDGFIKEAMRGKNIPLTYNYLKKPSTLSESLTKEIIQVLSPVVSNTQNAVFGMIQFLRDSGNKDMVSAKNDEMSAIYILKMLQRDRLFDTKFVGVADGVDTLGYYKASIIILFVLICGAVAAPYMIKSNTSLSSLLRSRGLGTLSQIFGEWLAFAFVISVSSALFASLITQDAGYGMKLIPALLLLTAMQMLMFEISNSTISGLLLQFFASIIMAYTCGMFYPSYLFPLVIQAIAKQLPVGQSFAYARQAMSDTLTASSIISIIIWTVIFLGITVAVRRIRMRGESI